MEQLKLFQQPLIPELPNQAAVARAQMLFEMAARREIERRDREANADDQPERGALVRGHGRRANNVDPMNLINIAGPAPPPGDNDGSSSDEELEGAGPAPPPGRHNRRRAPRPDLPVRLMVSSHE